MFTPPQLWNEWMRELQGRNAEVEKQSDIKAWSDSKNNNSYSKKKKEKKALDGDGGEG